MVHDCNLLSLAELLNYRTSLIEQSLGNRYSRLLPRESKCRKKTPLRHASEVLIISASRSPPLGPVIRPGAVRDSSTDPNRPTRSRSHQPVRHPRAVPADLIALRRDNTSLLTLLHRSSQQTHGGCAHPKNPWLVGASFLQSTDCSVIPRAAQGGSVNFALTRNRRDCYSKSE